MNCSSPCGQQTESAPFVLGEGEALSLRVFVDRSIVEAFANDRQIAVRRIYPARDDSTGVSLFCTGTPANVRSVSVWEMMPTNPY